MSYEKSPKKMMKWPFLTLANLIGMEQCTFHSKLSDVRVWCQWVVGVIFDDAGDCCCFKRHVILGCTDFRIAENLLELYCEMSHRYEYFIVETACIIRMGCAW